MKYRKVQDILRDASLGCFSHVQPEFCGVHPQNRSRLGVSGSEAHHHGAQILRSGFSWRKAADATAFEVPPPPHDTEAKACNEQFAALSGGAIPPLQQLKLLSVGGGHTNTFLRAVKVVIYVYVITYTTL